MPPGVRLDEKTSASCALTSWGDRLYVAWTGSDLHLNLAFWLEGHELAGKQRLAQRSYTWVDDSSLGKDRRRKVVGLAPSVVGIGEQLFLAWTGSDGALNVLVANSAGYSAPVTFKQRSPLSPTVAAAPDGDLVLAWTGTDRHVNLLTVGRQWEGQPVRLEAKTSASPALCSHDDNLVVAWTGTDRHINLLTVGRKGQSRPVRLEVKTSLAPALCSHDGDLMLAWTGTDRRVNLLTVGGQRASRIPPAAR
jgi:hypothetical protein